MGWINTPLVFRKPCMWDLDTKYPVNITEYNDDGTVTGIIDESRLTSAQRVLLEARLS